MGIFHALKLLLRRTGYDVVPYSPVNERSKLRGIFNALRDLRDLATKQSGAEELRFLTYIAQHQGSSQAQLFQDLLVQFILREKRDGFFVEFGATDGLLLSNTLLLERNFGWSGILAEPAKIWHSALQRNRNCMLDFRCVWDKDNETVEFKEVAAAELSTVSSFADSDLHAKSRTHGEVYSVQTVSLNTLLQQHGTPACIDFMSVDIEGTELKVLSAFDFSKYKIRVICIEHNFTAERDQIRSLLLANGFRGIFQSLSSWDDWYVARTP
jgi:FkbM family methyltransferase